MYNEHKNDGSRALVYLATLIFIGVAVWWLESRFNALTVVMVIGAVVGVACFAAGAFLSSSVQRNTMENLAKFNANDAATDRYRMMAYKENARGESAERAAHAKLAVLDAKRVDQLAQQRAGLLVDLERQKYQQAPQQTNAEWWNAPAFEDDQDQG
jgi:hypothetical protein